jgi:hypothetical protein
MNLTLTKIMQGLVDATNKEDLLHLLDVAKKGAQSDKTKLDEQNENLSNEDAEFDSKEIDINGEEIKNIYVSPTISW